MPTLSNEAIQKILNLKSSALISDAIAERQLQVIRKGFNYLSQDDNNVLYIADEVGLGKTYIALGIASLLRHFSPAPGAYQDVIIVPKENLQHKWEKEIRQFISRNYLLPDNRVKSVIGSPVGEPIKKDYLVPIEHDHPAYHLYRNTVFSMGVSWSGEGRKAQLEKLSSRLTLPLAREILQQAETSGYFLAGNKSYLKKLYAYLLSVCNPEIELLIVDEGHNYKQGLGMSEDDEVSDRNNVLARFFGLKRNSEEDKAIFDDFPQLRSLIRPKVQKLIVLSATPKTQSLLELKCQLDCFLPSHILSTVRKDEEVKELLPQFLIRGNMEYRIGENLYTRNLCRLEHRKGNVVKAVEAPSLSLKDHEQAIVLGLLQYNTIKHLGAKHNASFELGMLAGFETFRIDQEKLALASSNGNGKESELPEYEEFRTRRMRTSQDYSVLKGIIESYKNRFGSLPPHPKQDAIVEAAFSMMLQGEKSLIFVRRVASAYELERRLLDKWEEVVYKELKSVWTKHLPSRSLQQLLFAFETYKENRDLAENVEDIFMRVSEKLLGSKSIYPFNFLIPYREEAHRTILSIGLYYLYNTYKELSGGEHWYSLLVKHANLSIIKSELLQFSHHLLEQYYEGWWENIEKDEADEKEEVTDAYFFHSYFVRPHNKAFKKRLYTTDWFDVNYYKLNQHFSIASFNAAPLTKEAIHAKDSSDLKEVQEIFLKHVEESDYRAQVLDTTLYPAVLVEKSTLLTELIIRGCPLEFAGFLESWCGRRKSEVFNEIRHLFTIIKGCLRNGSGFLPLFVADKAEGDMIENYLALLLKDDSVFQHVIREVRMIIKDYTLIRAVNFPEGEGARQMESRLYYQSPVVGLTGQSKRSKSNVAAQFRMPGYPYVLITTDVFREGEDLHTYCQNIYHYGIAWNCSDMEQRTGRIDRINSQSHRRMMSSGSVLFDDRIHVFYPYVQHTLEVNQVSRLFASINAFVETFNDFTGNIKEEGVASTGEAIEWIPPVVEKPLHSRFEHHYFKGCGEEEGEGTLSECIGVQEEEILHVLRTIEGRLVQDSSFYFGPELDKDTFSIRGDRVLIGRSARRGPFIIQVKNDVCPGKFLLEVSSHLFKVSSKVQKVARELMEHYHGQYAVGNIDDFYALSFTVRLEEGLENRFKTDLEALVAKADEIEEIVTKEDVNIFG